MLQKFQNKMNEKKYRLIYHEVECSKYREFLDDREATNWGNKTYLNWAVRYKEIMSQVQMNNVNSNSFLPYNCLECYCGYEYRQINRFLRDGTDNEYHHYREKSDILSLLLMSAPRIPDDIILYRVVCDEFIEELIDNNKKGMPATLEKGFLSTSLIKQTIISDVEFKGSNSLLKIYVDEGTIGLYVNSVTRRNEQEMLLYPNYYLGLVNYPYEDTASNKTIYECKLIYF